MAKFIKIEGDFRIYELEERECKFHGREYPTIVCWNKNDREVVGDLTYTENETGTIEEMVAWCKKHSK